MTVEPTLPAERMRAALRVRRIGRSLQSVGQTASTNDLCWARLEEAGDAADGFVAMADCQTAGRGRFGRAWLAPRASSLLGSALIVQPGEPMLLERISLIAGITACQAARQVSEAEIRLRWPNDLIGGNRKVGGVLVESRPWTGGRVALVIGVGVNCLQQPGHFPPELRDKAASLDMLSGQAISRLDLAVEWIGRLDSWLADPIASPADVRSAWLDLAEPLGRRVYVLHAGQRLCARTVELDPTGGLLVELESGGRQIFPPATTTLEIAE